MSKENIKTFLETGQYDDAEQLLNTLMECSVEEIMEILSDVKVSEINPANIPQYSNFFDSTINLIDHLWKIGDDGQSFEEIGQHFMGGRRKKWAYEKYGENQSKLARALLLVEIRREEKYKVYLTDIGKIIEKMPEKNQMLCLSRLAATIPIVQYCLKNNIDDRIAIKEALSEHLSKSTVDRRNGNVFSLIEFARGNKSEFKRPERDKKNI